MEIPSSPNYLAIQNFKWCIAYDTEEWDQERNAQKKVCTTKENFENLLINIMADKVYIEQLKELLKGLGATDGK